MPKRVSDTARGEPAPKKRESSGPTTYSRATTSPNKVYVVVKVNQINPEDGIIEYTNVIGVYKSLKLAKRAARDVYRDCEGMGNDLPFTVENLRSSNGVCIAYYPYEDNFEVYVRVEEQVVDGSEFPSDEEESGEEPERFEMNEEYIVRKYLPHMIPQLASSKRSKA